MDTLQSAYSLDWTTTGQHADGASDAIVHLRNACRRLEHLARLDGTCGMQPFHRVVSLIHDMCDALAEAESADTDPGVLRTIVASAREIHGCSPFIKRLQDWPRGYPGDFETIEWLWRGDNRAPSGTLAHAFETYALSASIAQQHRNKVALQAACVRQAMAGGRACRVLSIGCGSCPDLRSLIGQTTPGSQFVLCDSDPDALALCRSELAPLDGQCQFVPGLVPRVLRRVRGHAPFDVIVAGGLFDYLSDRFIVRTLGEAWHALLAPGGRILFTNIGRGNPFRMWLEYLASWRLIERSEQDILRLCEEAQIPIEPALAREKTGLAIVATLRKSATQ